MTAHSAAATGPDLTAVADHRYSSEMIIRARIVVTMAGAPIENGAVAISADRIVDVGSSNDVKKRNAGNTLDLGEQVLLPGLINAHCHLDYTCLREKIPPQKSFAYWIRAINAEKTTLSQKDYLASINDGFAEAKRFGTTTIANLTAFPELIPQINPPVRTFWFPELIDVRAPERASELVDAALESIRNARPQLVRREGTPGGLAPHAPFTASTNLFRYCENIAQHDDILLTTHLAESREEMQMFRDASGPLYEFLKSIGRPMDDCGASTPLKHFLKIRDSSTPLRFAGNDSGWIIAHLNELTESDFDLLEQSNLKFAVVHCPRSHEYFGHSPFAFDRLRSLGFNVCLGTDSLATNKTLSLFDEMRVFQKNFPRVLPEEILRMVTVNPARALRCKSVLGQIGPGFGADLVALPCASSTDIFEQIISFEEPINWIMINGECE